MKGFEEVRFQFIRREENLITDLLARSCDTYDVDIQIIDVPNPQVSALVLKDAYHISFD